MSSTTWSDDVIARYLTLAGAALADRTITVDVIDRSDNKNRFSWSCTGCNHSVGEWTDSYHVQGRAQAHAGTCRAIPRPAN